MNKSRKQLFVCVQFLSFERLHNFLLLSIFSLFLRILCWPINNDFVQSPLKQRKPPAKYLQKNDEKEKRKKKTKICVQSTHSQRTKKSCLFSFLVPHFFVYVCRASAPLLLNSEKNIEEGTKREKITALLNAQVPMKQINKLHNNSTFEIFFCCLSLFVSWYITKFYYYYFCYFVDSPFCVFCIVCT